MMQKELMKNYETMLNERYDGSVIDEKQKRFSKRTCENEFDIKHLYAMVLEN